MSLKKKAWAILCIIFTSFAYTEGFDSSNIYVDGNVGLNTSWSNAAFNVDAGYMLNRYWGAEIGWTYSPGYSYGSGVSAYSSNYNMLDFAGKGVLPISNNMNLYGKLGIAYNNYSGTYTPCSSCGTPAYAGSNLATLLAAGISYDINKSVSVHAEDNYIWGPNPNLILVGAEYRFK